MNKRFSELLRSQDQTGQLTLTIYDSGSPHYPGSDIILELNLGKFKIFWHPKTINGAIRFFRFFEDPEKARVELR